MSEERQKIEGQRAGEKEDANKQSTQTLTIRWKQQAETYQQKLLFFMRLEAELINEYFDNFVQATGHEHSRVQASPLQSHCSQSFLSGDLLFMTLMEIDKNAEFDNQGDTGDFDGD